MSESDEWEADEDGEAGDDGVDTLPCPACGEAIYEDAEQCPYCGDYVMHSTSALAGRPIWFCVLGLLGVAATIVYLVH